MPAKWEMKKGKKKNFKAFPSPQRLLCSKLSTSSSFRILSRNRTSKWPAKLFLNWKRLLSGMNFQENGCFCLHLLCGWQELLIMRRIRQISTQNLATVSMAFFFILRFSPLNVRVFAFWWRDFSAASLSG